MMYRVWSRSIHLSPCLGLGAIAVAALFAAVPATGSDALPNVTRVEQDWILVLNEPQSSVGAPQLHTVFSPNGSLDGLYAQVSWNYAELPGFNSGGLQIQAWYAKNPVAFASYGNRPLSTSAETITWTQVLSTDGSQLTLQISNGTSQSWGHFGGKKLTLTGQTPIANLNSYSTDVSVKNSQVTYGSNRVQLLAIREVRYYGQEGLLLKDSATRIVSQIN